ncbi:hypothetical protein [Actinomadura decatromicini]|uniref:Uncharacterized protein n=1 Tax=Actinomadura decatromicini TaxID=2604572 RepID=A0A5D3FT03_9ACTN|nr:hypothetical protein [Actinomadura decatromicini]TYK51229.1 hypothetical protein FXF68_12475 [Actinomadura decatromicini]
MDEVVPADLRSAINPPCGFGGNPLYGTADLDHPDLGRLGRAVDAAAEKYHGDDYDGFAAVMPALVRSAHHHVDAYDTGGDRREALRLRAHVTGLAGRYLIQIRAHDLALIALRTSLRDALEIGNIPLAAASVSSQAWAMLRQGRLDEVQQLCVDAADQIEPKTSAAARGELSGWRYLLRRAAAAASRNNRAAEAGEYARRAATADARLGEQTHDSARPKTFGLLARIEIFDDRPDKAVQPVQDTSRGVGRVTTSTDRHRLGMSKGAASARGRRQGD